MSIDSTLTRRMSMAKDVSPESQFVPAVLPWVLATAGLLVYLATLNHWVSFSSVFNVGMVSGWNWQPELYRPLYWLVTWPIRLLPPSLIPLALNLFSAVCATLTLALLARSVSLLPHDRTEEQRLRERSAFSLLSIRTAWVPPVLAILVCGLQLTFWENATAASSEIFDLLLFAYVVRCLLEFRIQGSDSWLVRAAFIYGAAMTNNWAMIGFFPLFLTALIWIKGLSFFNVRFLRQMFLLGTLGLCFYLLLPAVASSSKGAQLDFWQALKFNLGQQKSALTLFIFNKVIVFQGDHPLWVLTLPSLVPLIFMSFRWPSYFGDPSKLGVAVATSIFHFLHAVILVVCVWVALDPLFSPRNYFPVLMDIYGMLMLPLYYLGALSVGYFSGYFLLIFGGAPPMLRARALPGYPKLINALVTGAVWLLLPAVPLALLYKNLGQIRTTNGPMLRQFAEFMADKVPTQGSVILSDEPMRLALLKSVWTQKGVRSESLLLDTSSLSRPAYHRFLRKQNSKRWTASLDADRKDFFKPPELQRLVVDLSTNSAVYYLHPSFGYYFEELYPEPHGLVYKLNRFPANSLLVPPLTKEIIEENQAFWQRLDNSQLKPVLEASRQEPRNRDSSRWGRFISLANLIKEPNRDASRLATVYSRTLDFWGVLLQRNGMLREAADYFNRARDLYHDNVVAEVNLRCNSNLQAGQKSLIQRTRFIEEQLGRYPNLEQVMNVNGPFDEATFCYALGTILFQGGNFRQAAEELHRAAFLAPEENPENLQSRLVFARAAIYRQAAPEALKAINEIHSHSEALGLSRTNAPELLSLESVALLITGDQAGAEKAVQSTLDKYPGDEQLLSTVTSIYLNSGLFSNALGIIDQQLRIRPNDPSALVNKGLAWLRLGQYSNAIPPLTEVIKMGTNGSSDVYYYALYNRGLAFWKDEKLNEAQKDYEILQKTFPAAMQFSYGLGEIAYAKKDTNAAIRNYQLFLAGTPPTNAPETSNALVRLKELRRYQR